jgi:hypothetical protein
MTNFHLFFFSEQVGDGIATGPDPENRVGGQDIGCTVRPGFCVLQVTSELGHCRARTIPPW